jgi:hypothetical protein
MNGKIKVVPGPRGDPAKASTIGEFNPAILLLIHFSEGSKSGQSSYFDTKIVSLMTLEWSYYTLTS